MSVQVAFGVGINCATCCKECVELTASFKIKSITIWLPWCGTSCGVINQTSKWWDGNNPGPEFGIPVASNPLPGASGCDNDDAHLCAGVQFLAVSAASPGPGYPIPTLSIDKYSCQVTQTGYFGDPIAALSTPSDIPTQANLYMDLMVTQNLNLLQWGQHLCVYPSIDPVASAAGKCPAAIYGSVPGSYTMQDFACVIETPLSLYNHAYFDYSVDTIPAWIPSNIALPPYSPIIQGTIYAYNGPTHNAPYYGGSGGFYDPPGFPDATYGDPCFGFWMVQVVVLEIDGAGLCIYAPPMFSSPLGNVPCYGTFPPSEPGALPCPANPSQVVTLRATLPPAPLPGQPTVPYYGSMAVYLAAGYCDPCSPLYGKCATV